MPGVNRNDLHALTVRATRDLGEQRAIASVLSAYDDLIENNRRRIRLLEQTGRLVYEEWFVRLRFPGYEHVAITDGTPTGWRRRTIGEVCPLRYGRALGLPVEMKSAGCVEIPNYAGRTFCARPPPAATPSARRSSDHMKTNIVVRIRDSIHAAVGRDDDQVALLRLRAYPQVVLVDLEPFSSRAVDPIFHPTRPVLPQRLGQILAGQVGLQFSICGGRMSCNFQNCIFERSRQRPTKMGRRGSRDGLGQPKTIIKFRYDYRRYELRRSRIERAHGRPHVTMARMFRVNQRQEDAGVENVPGHDRLRSVGSEKLSFVRG